MSSIGGNSKKEYNSDDDDDDFFSNGTSPARTQTRVISKRRQSPENLTENSDDDQNGRSKATGSSRRHKSKVSPRTASVSPYSASSRRTSVQSPYSTDTSLVELHSSVRKSHSRYGNIRKNTGLRGSQSAKKMPKISPNSKKTSVAKLMLSAKQQEINDLLSKLSHAKQKLATAEKENKLLKRLQNRQDKAIRKFEDTENDLPRLLSKNSEDQRTLKFQLRRSQDTKRSLEAKLHQNNEEMQRMEGVLLRLKKLVCDKSLGESSELSTQLAETETKLQVAKNKIKELNKKIELRIAKHTKQLNTERQKHRDTLSKLQKLHEQYTETDTKLKERERAMNVSNIYSMRKKISPEKALLSICSITPNIDTPKIAEPEPALITKAEDQNEMNDEENTADPFSNTSPSLNRLHSDVSGAKPQNEKRSVFLTTDLDSLMASRNNSFFEESRTSSSRGRSGRRMIQKQKVVEEETDFADDLRKTEQEIKKLQIAVRQKADLLAKLQQIDQSESNELDIPKSKSPTFSSSKPVFSLKSNSKMSLLNSDVASSSYRDKQQPTDLEPLKPGREISFGGYAPTVGGLTRRKSPAVRKKPTVVANQSPEIDEPLFDLSSGRTNKKSDLLAQLFGGQEGVKSTAAV